MHIKRINEINSTCVDLSSKSVLDTAHKKYSEYLDSFNIGSLPASVKDTVIDYRFASKFADDVSESAIMGLHENHSVKIESVSNVVKGLQEKYKMSGVLFTAYNPFGVEIVRVEKIPNYLQTTNSILLPFVLESVETIKGEMKNNGYYCVSERTYYDSDTNKKWVMLVFDPMSQEDISTQIRAHCDVLYHCSPLENKDSIEKHGLLPKNEGRVYKYYEDRVYLHVGSPKTSEFRKMMGNITKNRKRKDPLFDGNYVLYYIDVDSLDKNIEFFKDPHGSNSIYTKVAIPVDSIIRNVPITF